LIKINEKILKDYLGIEYKSILCDDFRVSTEIDEVKQIVDHMISPNKHCISHVKESKLIFLKQNYNVTIKNFTIILSEFLDINESFTTKALGISKVIQFEFLITTVQIFIETNSPEILYRLNNDNSFVKFLHKACKLYFTFEFNNIYHQLFENFVKILLGKNTPFPIIFLLIDVQGLDLINKLQIKIKKNQKFKFSSGSEVNSLNFASMIKVFLLFFESENLRLVQEISTHTYSSNIRFLNIFIRPIIEIFNSGLLVDQKLKEKVLNFDKLEEYEYFEDDPEKENKIEIPLYSMSIKEIIQSRLHEFEYEFFFSQENISVLDTGFELEKYQENDEEDIDMIINKKVQNNQNNLTQINLKIEENRKYYDNNFWSHKISLSKTEMLNDILNELLN
jgi:hypothetical protein